MWMGKSPKLTTKQQNNLENHTLIPIKSSYIFGNRFFSSGGIPNQKVIKMNQSTSLEYNQQPQFVLCIEMNSYYSIFDRTKANFYDGFHKQLRAEGFYNSTMKFRTLLEYQSVEHFWQQRWNKSSYINNNSKTTIEIQMLAGNQNLIIILTRNV